MKSLSVKLGVILIGLIILTYAEVWGTDWKVYGETDKATFYYDTESITHPSKDVVRVWTKQVYTEKGIIEMVGDFGEIFRTLNDSIDLREYHCVDKKYCLLYITFYSTDGEVLSTVNYSEPMWYFIVPRSIGEDIYDILCK